MTRLTEEMLPGVRKDIEAWSRKLKKITGLDLAELAAETAGVSRARLEEAGADFKVAAVPVTCGDGVIGNFSETVAAAVAVMGFDSFVTEATDVNGIYEAAEKGADVIFMADEERYLALNVRTGKATDNNEATARGYIEILDRVSGGIKGRTVLVLGYGTIGRLMCDIISGKGGKPAVFAREGKSRSAALHSGFEIAENREDIKKYSLIADATSEGGWLKEGMLSEDAYYVTPGVPESLTEEAAAKLRHPPVHDNLEIGTAVMLAMAIKGE